MTQLDKETCKTYFDNLVTNQAPIANVRPSDLVIKDEHLCASAVNGGSVCSVSSFYFLFFFII